MPQRRRSGAEPQRKAALSERSEPLMKGRGRDLDGRVGELVVFFFFF
jgi:hypothetical protein